MAKTLFKKFFRGVVLMGGVLVCSFSGFTQNSDSTEVNGKHQLGLVVEYSQERKLLSSSLWLRLSPTYGWRTKNGNQWVANFNRMNVERNKPNNNFDPDIFESEIGKRLQYNILFGGEKKRFYPKLGIESQLAVSYYKSVPYISTSFLYWDFDTRLSQNISVGFVTFGKRISTQFEIASDTGYIGVLVRHNESPYIPERNQTQSFLDFDMISLSRFYGRFGVAYRL